MDVEGKKPNRACDLAACLNRNLNKKVLKCLAVQRKWAGLVGL